MILRCRFHCKNAGFEDLTTGILHFLVPRIPWGFWYYMGLDGFFSRLYILLRILSSNAFGHFGLGKCKLLILRCRFHGKNAGFEDLTTGILHFLVPRIPWGFWYYVGFDWFFSRLYILLRILSSNAFGHFGLGKCKLMILRCRFHGKNAGFEDFTTGILHFLVPRIPWEFWYYMGFDGFFLGCTFSCAFFPAMPLDILVLENVG